MLPVVALVHDDKKFVVEAALCTSGYCVISFADPVLPWEALESVAVTIDLLITQANFPPPGGSALAQMLKRKHPAIKIVFVTREPSPEYLGDLGKILFTPIAMPDLVATTARSLQKLDSSAWGAGRNNR